MTRSAAVTLIRNSQQLVVGLPEKLYSESDSLVGVARGKHERFASQNSSHQLRSDLLCFFLIHFIAPRRHHGRVGETYNQKGTE